MFTVAGWNWGGVATDLGPTSLASVDPGKNAPLGVLAVQEVRRTALGWSSEQVGKWTLTSYQPEESWRGTGILFDALEFGVMRRIPTQKGTWFRLRHLRTNGEFWIGALYLAPHLNTTDMQGYLIEHMDKLPATTMPVYLSGDSNAALHWGTLEDTLFPFGHESKAKTLIDTLQCYGYALTPPRMSQRYQATSRPSRDDAQGHVIDWIACKHAACSSVTICTNSSKEMGTDHDCLRISTSLKGRTSKPRIVSGPRVMKTQPRLCDHVDQEVLKDMAVKHTARPTTARYRDDGVTKQLFKIAKSSRKADDWKRALRSRKEVYQKWQDERTNQAMNGNWKELKQLRPASNKGWEAGLAEHLQPHDPHQALHAHYQEIFSSGELVQCRSSAPPPAKDITEEELDFALAQGHKGKSVGHDGVSHELLMAIAQLPQGKRQLLDWFNQILHGGQIPPDWLESLMVLLPKTRSPKQAKDTRPISMTCAAEKTFCRILLERTKPFISLTRPWQCAGPRGQTCDYLYAIHKLFEEEREWCKGLCALKIDLRRAFDSVRRDKLLHRLWDLQGDTEEFCIWERLMTGTSCTLRSPWGQTTFATMSGIRQGSIESPAFCGILIEWVLSDIMQDKKWNQAVSTYDDLLVTQVAFMDDLVLWDGTSTEVARRFHDLSEGFKMWGLTISPEKCSLYVSPKHQKPSTVTLDTCTLRAQDFIEVMNVPFKVGANTQELLQRTWQKARDKFWSMRHLLMSNTPIGNRLHVLDRIVGGAILWNSAAFTPEPASLTAINQTLYQFVLWMLKLRKRPGEAWADFRKRGLRQARQLVCNHLRARWSTQWLSRHWGFMGHVARGILLDSPPCSSVLCHHRPLEWWELQQRTTSGLRHSGRFFPKLSDHDKKLNRAAQGLWREKARDRVEWRRRAEQWILQNDVSWTSGQQFAIEW